MTDAEQFILALQEGSEQAFRQLVEERQQQVLRTCLGFVPSRQDAEDITQEVFVEVFRSVRAFKRESSLNTWIYRIAVRKALEYIRKMKRKKRFDFLKDWVGLDDERVQTQSDHFYHPGILLENQERAKILYQQLDRLPDSQRTAFLLQKSEDMSLQEIANVLQVSVSAVESLLHRAKKNLRDRLLTLTDLHHE